MNNELISYPEEKLSEMNWKEIMGLVSTITVVLPILIIAFLRLHRFKCFLALGVYYIVNFLSNVITQNYIPAGESFKKFFGVTDNLLDVPLILSFLVYFSPSSFLSKRMRYSVFVFLAFEVIVTLIYGYNRNAITIIMGPGLALIFGICTWFFLRQVKIAVMYQKATGKVLMISALLFAYGCYVLIYIMYYLLETNAVSDVFLIYFIAGALSSLTLSAGMIIENKRIKKLEELKITRKELNAIYSGSSPEKKSLSGIEKEQWN